MLSISIKEFKRDLNTYLRKWKIINIIMLLLSSQTTFAFTDIIYYNLNTYLNFFVIYIK